MIFQEIYSNKEEVELDSQQHEQALLNALRPQDSQLMIVSKLQQNLDKFRI